MAKGSRGGQRGTGGGVAKGELQLPDGSKIEFDGELHFDGDDKTLKGQARKSIESWEAKRRNAKIEYAYSVDGDGNQIDNERRGGKGSVRSSRAMHDTENATFTHNHPRGDGMLGGTFSDADLKNFANFKNKTCRATAKEGTYSISKGANFDQKGFLSMVRESNSKFDTTVNKISREYGNKYRNNEINYNQYLLGVGKAFNTALVQLHNDYRNGQKKYGYTYTLEKYK